MKQEKKTTTLFPESVNAADGITASNSVAPPNFTPEANQSNLDVAENPASSIQMKAEPFQMKKGDEEEEELQMKQEPFQMKNEEEEEELQMKAEPFQMKKGDEEEEEIQMKKDGVSNKSSNSGSSTKTRLPEKVQMKMESAFSADFNDVNIHTHSEKAKGLGAKAFAQGNDVHFAPGKYNPESQSGQELLGHELTHVVQQRQGRVSPSTQMKGENINDQSTLENEADLQGIKAARGETTDLTLTGNNSRSNIIQKDDDDELEASLAQSPNQIFGSGQTQVTSSGARFGGRRTIDTPIFSENIPIDSSQPLSDDNSENISMGNRAVSSGNASINNQGHIGINGSHTTHTTYNGETDPSSRRSISGGGFVDLGPNGQLEGGGGNLGLGVGRTTVNVGGAYHVSASEPVRIQDYYEVSWIRSYSGSTGGSMSGAHNTSGGLTLNGSESVTGKRRFATLVEAQAFYTDRDWVDIDPSDAQSLGQGDSITESSSTGLRANGSVNIEGVTVGASINVGSNHTVQVTGLGDQQISVKVTDQAILGAGATLGVVGLSMGVSGQTSQTDGFIVDFDLSTETGRRSFNFLREHGILSGSGYNMRASIEGTSDQRTTTIGVAGASLAMTSTVSETTTTHTDGHTVAERQGTDSSALTVPLLGSFNESDSLTATDDSNVENRTYTVRNTVSGSDTGDVNTEIARSTGTHYNTPSSELSNQSSRNWTITSSFSHRQVSQLVSAIRAGRFNYHRLIYQAGHGEDFIQAVRSAGNDWDAIDRAFTEFISETGDKGLELVRDTISARPVFSIELQGDPYLRGESGHTALRNRITAFSDSLSSETGNPRSIGISINREISEQQIRLAAISDPERYPDLPNELRHQEVTRSQAEISELENLRDRALSLGGTSPDTSPPVQEEENLQNENEQTSSLPVANTSDQLATLEIRGNEMRSQAVSSGNTARRHNWIHHGAYCFHRSAFETWGETHWYGDDDHVSEYRDAHSFLELGNSAWSTAQQAWTEYQQMKNNLLFGEGNPEAALAKLLFAVNKFSFAKTAFNIASRHFQSVRNQHSDNPGGQFNGYRENRGLPDNLALE